MSQSQYYVVDELYLRQHPMYADDYEQLLAKVQQRMHRRSPLTFAFVTDDIRSNEQSTGDMRRPKEDQSVSQYEFFYNRQQVAMDRFKREKTCHYIACVADLQGGEPLLFEQAFKVPHLPEAVEKFVYQQYWMLMQTNMNKDAVNDHSPKHRAFLQRVKEYRSMRSHGHSAVFATTSLLHDEYGLARCDVANMLINTRQPDTLYMGVTQVFRPYEMREMPVRVLHTFEYPYAILNNRSYNQCVRYGIGGHVVISDMPLPYSKYPAEGKVVEFGGRQFYRLTSSEIKRMLDGNLFR